MKIKLCSTIEKVTVSNVSDGGVFSLGRDTAFYMRCAPSAIAPQLVKRDPKSIIGVNLKTGILYEFEPNQEIVPRENAELRV